VVIKKFRAEQEAVRVVEQAFQEQEQKDKSEDEVNTHDSNVQDVTIFTASYRIEGQIRISAKGYRSRLSDFLNDEGFKFVPILNAKISSLVGDVSIPFTEVVVLNKDEITMVVAA
jgi:hypothetical protein